MELTGVVKTIIYRNEDNGFTVLELTDESGDEIAAVGPMPLARVGERIEITGEYAEHKTYGMQFKASSCKTLAPATLQTLIGYLSSGLIKGVGESTAKNIVACFGMDTIRVMEEEPERLTEVPGIGRMRANTIGASFTAQREMRDIMLGLQEYGVTVAQSMKLYKIYGPLCLAKINENPYRLIDDVENIGFKTADKIALKAGVEASSPFRLRAGLKYTLQWAVREGHTCLPREKLIEVASELLQAEIGPVESQLDEMIVAGDVVYKIVENTDCVFLPALYAMESYCASRLSLLNRAPNSNLFAMPALRITALEKQLGIELAPLQKQAVTTALTSGAMVITGGPGTGKTTILKFILRIMDELGLTLELCAPTGRAAKRMSEATGAEARTIHRMLEYDFRGEGFIRNEDNPLHADMIIVDEMSMVDVPLMNALLRAVGPETRLVMVGDADQLPSVGPGNVLRDIIKAGAVPVIRLNEIFRQSERSGIVVGAHDINSGRMPRLDAGEDFTFEELQSAEEVIRRVVGLCAGKTDKLLTRDPLKDVQVLAPMKKGPLGVRNLNARLQAALNPPAHIKRERQYGDTVFREGDKVMQIKNNYLTEWTRDIGRREPELGQGVFNGDLGTLMEIDFEDQYVTVLFDDARAAQYSFTMLEELELAYCVSIHKSQGSEFPIVLLPLLGGPAVLMTRNLLYTAVTRARKQVYMVGHSNAVRTMVENQQVRRRYSSLASMLGGSFGG